MPLLPIQRRGGNCDLGKAVRDITYLMKCLDDAIEAYGTKELSQLIKSLAICAEHSDSAVLITALGYSFTKNPTKTLKASVDVLLNSRVVLKRFIEALSAIIGMHRLITLSAKYKLLNEVLINSVIDKLSCYELAVLTESISDVALDMDTVLKVITKALTTTYCNDSKKAAIKLITKLLVDGRLSKDSLVKLLKKLNMRLVIIKSKSGEIKEVKLISRVEENLPVDEVVNSLINYVI